jgi:hypothetical protein
MPSFYEFAAAKAAGRKLVLLGLRAFCLLLG